MPPAARAAALLVILLPLTAAQIWRYVNFFAGTGFSADGDGNLNETSVVVGEMKVLTSMSVHFTRRLSWNTLIEWGNLLDKGRTFAEQWAGAGTFRTLMVYAVEDAQVTVSNIVSGAVVTSKFIAAGTAELIQYHVNPGSDISSDGDILAHLRYGNVADSLNYPVLPPAAVIFGTCSQWCSFVTPGASAGTVHKVCSDGTVEDLAANAEHAGTTHYNGPVCRYEAPAGQLMAGYSRGDGSGVEITAFVSSDQFQEHFVFPLPAALVLVFSDQPANCSYWLTPLATPPTIVEFQLQGFSERDGAPGVYFTKIETVARGTVFCCDVPVGAMGDFTNCGPGVSCTGGKEVNILARSSTPSSCSVPSVSTSSTTATSSTSSPTTTTSSITTASSTATTTTTPLVPPPAAGELLKLALKWEKELAILVPSDSDTVSFTRWNITSVAVRVYRADAGVPVPVGTTGTEVALPDSLFANLELEVALLTATSFGDSYNERLEWTANGEDTLAEGSRLISITVHAVAHVDLRGYNVSNLPDPIAITMPINRTAGLECAYWDDDSGLWRNDGVTLQESPLGGAVVCQSTHLSLFAAIKRGFLQAFACSQVKLFTSEAVLELGRQEWAILPAAWAFWGLLAVFFVLLLLAAVQDCRRGSLWCDEDFLVVMQEVQPEVEEEAIEEPGEAKQASWCACICAATCGLFWAWCKESGAIRDVIDEVASNYFSYFSELRDFVESIMDNVGCSAEGSEGGGCFTWLNWMMTSMVLSSAERQAAAAEGISADLASYAYEDEDLHGILMQQHRLAGQQNEESADVRPPAAEHVSKGQHVSGLQNVSEAGSSSQLKRHCPQEQVEHWSKLLDGLTTQTYRFTSASGQCTSLPCAVCRLLLWQHPISSCFARCVFMSSKIRVFLMMVDTIGAVLLGTVFYNSTGTVPSKRNRSASCNFTEVGDMIGRLLAIGTVSIVLSSIPAMILGSLSTRSIKTLAPEDEKGWNRQLRVWRIQDGLIWTFGTLYMLFAVFFVCLFLANTAAKDHSGWLVSVAISMLEDLVVIPLFVALSIPFSAAFFLSVLSCCGQSSKQELLNAATQKVCDKPNLKLEVVQV